MKNKNANLTLGGRDLKKFGDWNRKDSKIKL